MTSIHDTIGIVARGDKKSSEKLIQKALGALKIEKPEKCRAARWLGRT